MLVSNFELLVKRILPLAPPGLPDAATNSVGRRIVQAHFLTISNLELDRPVYFNLSYVVSTLTSPLRRFELTSTGLRNFDLVYDGNGLDNTSINLGTT